MLIIQQIADALDFAAAGAFGGRANLTPKGEFRGALWDHHTTKEQAAIYALLRKLGCRPKKCRRKPIGARTSVLARWTEPTPQLEEALRGLFRRTNSPYLDLLP